MKKGVDKWGMEAYTNQVASRGAAARKKTLKNMKKVVDKVLSMRYNN